MIVMGAVMDIFMTQWGVFTVRQELMQQLVQSKKTKL